MGPWLPWRERLIENLRRIPAVCTLGQLEGCAVSRCVASLGCEIEYWAHLACGYFGSKYFGGLWNS